MALLLTEQDVRTLLTMPMALEAVEEVFRRLAEGTAELHPRRRLQLPERSFLHYMAAADSVSGYAGLKMYTSLRGDVHFLVPLFEGKSGMLVALLEADHLGRIRTGAASGVATKYMARDDARTVGIIGTGRQARTQLEGVCAVRKIEHVRAFSRIAERRAEFAQEMGKKLGVSVEDVGSAELAVRDAEIVITATNSASPVVHGAWLLPGAHVNAIGANFPHMRELDEDAVRRTGIVAVDSREQARSEAGDLIAVLGEDAAHWSAVRELSDIVAGKTSGRTGERQITLFKSTGVAIEDIAVAARVFSLATKRGMGQPLPVWETPA